MKPYESPDGKKEQVRKMFDGIAPRYDLLNRVLSLGIDRGWRRKTVKEVACQNPRRIIDLATGTGDLAITLARRLPDAEITGIDLSAVMLEMARMKLEKARLNSRIKLAQGEGENLPCPDSSFDSVTIAFGIRNFDDIPASLRETLRVLRPGGKIYILEFSTPRNRLFGALYRFYFHKILPWIGGLVSRDRKAYTYLPGSVDEFPSPAEFSRTLSECGFANPQARSFTGGVSILYIAQKPTTNQ